MTSTPQPHLDNYRYLPCTTAIDDIVLDTSLRLHDEHVKLLDKSIQRSGFDSNAPPICVVNPSTWYTRTESDGTVISGATILDGYHRVRALRKLRASNQGHWGSLCDNLPVTVVIRRDGKRVDEAEMVHQRRSPLF